MNNDSHTGQNTTQSTTQSYTQNAAPTQGYNNNKRRQPDFHASLITRDDKGKEHSWDFGALWEGKNGYLTGQTPQGRMILQPHEEKQKLKKMREQQKQSQTQGQTHNNNIE